MHFPTWTRRAGKVGHWLILLWCAADIHAHAWAQTGTGAIARDPKNPPAGVSSEARKYWSPLGLPRLRSAVVDGDARPVAREAFEIDNLDAPSDPARAAGIRIKERDRTKVIEIDTGKDWTRPLRLRGHAVVFVSAKVYASVGTTLRVGGIEIRVADGVVPHTCTLVSVTGDAGGSRTESLGVHAPEAPYGGHVMAEFPVLTFRIDTENNVWDLYAGPRQVADNLPLAEPARGAGALSFTVLAGADQAWLTGLVQSVENPIVEDANANGIDDDFEKAALGNRTLDSRASLSERHALAERWREYAAQKRAPAFLTEGPKPDAITSRGAGSNPPQAR
jgi:hypothetical protein